MYEATLPTTSRSNFHTSGTIYSFVKANFRDVLANLADRKIRFLDLQNYSRFLACPLSELQNCRSFVRPRVPGHPRTSKIQILRPHRNHAGPCMLLLSKMAQNWLPWREGHFGVCPRPSQNPQNPGTNDSSAVLTRGTRGRDDSSANLKK